MTTARELVRAATAAGAKLAVSGDKLTVTAPRPFGAGDGRRTSGRESRDPKTARGRTQRRSFVSRRCSLVAPALHDPHQASRPSIKRARCARRAWREPRDDCPRARFAPRRPRVYRQMPELRLREWLHHSPMATACCSGIAMPVDVLNRKYGRRCNGLVWRRARASMKLSSGSGRRPTCPNPAGN